MATHSSEALARDGVSREVPCSVLKWETVLGSIVHCTTTSGVPRGAYQLHSIPHLSEAHWEVP